MSSDANTVEELRYGPALRDRILGLFSGRMRPVPVPPLYRLGLVVVAVAMVLLPLVYVGLIAAAGYGVYYHATSNLDIFEHVKPAKVALLAYGGPLVIGIILVFFMVKPLFARPAGREAPRSLRREGEPLLYAYVEKLCSTVGAPFPRRIDVDCQVNASASFRRGWVSLLSQDLVLTLGLPLVRGLTLQQLTGVLAHEFGHFAQGAGMRLTYVVRSVNHWFLRVVYERDSWDQQLAEAAASNHGFLTVVVWGARGMVWLTRRILWVLMQLGHAISCFMLRQMEFDADRYEARMVGAATFESTCRELTNLNVAYQKTLSDLGASWQDGRLVDNLPGLVGANRHDFDSELVSRIQSQVDAGTTGLFDTHPADPDRIAGAQREGEEAIFRSRLAAAALFQGFDQLAAEVSLDFYRASLGDAVRAESLQDLGEIRARQEADTAEAQSTARFFQGTVHPLRPLELPAAASGERGRDDLLAELTGDRGVLVERGAAHREDLRSYDVADRERLAALQAESLAEHGVKFSARDLGLPASELSAAMDARVAATRRIEELDAKLSDLEAVAARRLRNALELAPRRAEAGPLVAAAAALGEQKKRLDGLRTDYLVLGMLGSVFQENSDNEKLAAAIQRLAEKLHGHLRALGAAWAEIEYPFDHADASMTLGKLVVPSPPDANDLGQIFGLAEEALDRSLNLYPRLLGRLGRIAEEGEEELGLEPLPEPPEDDEPRDEE